MHTKIPLVPLFAALCLAGSSLCLNAQDAGRADQVPLDKELRTFCEKHLPLALQLLTMVWKEESREEFDDVVEQAGEWKEDYDEILKEDSKEDSKEEAEFHLREVGNELNIDLLTYRWHASEENGKLVQAEQAAIKEKLIKALRERMEIEIAINRSELAELRAEIAELETGLAKMEASKEKLIAADLKDLLELNEGEEDEDEGNADDE